MHTWRLTVPSLYLHGPGARHFPHLEQPQTVADHFLGFLNN
ncbi:hypothetical protein ACIRVK_43270 [Streptomyces sp. NPDC101152]